MTANKFSSKIFWILGYALSSIHFFSPTFVDTIVLKTFYLFALIYVILFYIIEKNKINVNFKREISYTLVLILLSSIPAYTIWGQDFSLTLTSILPYLGYFFYLYLTKYLPNPQKIEKLIEWLGAISVALIILGILTYPFVLFGEQVEKISTDRGLARVSMAGAGFIFLSYFMVLNKLVKERNTKLVLLAVFYFVGICLLLTRQLIVATILITVFFILTSRGSKIQRIAFLTLLTGIILYASSLFFVKILFSQTEQQFQNREDNIRLIASKYFLYDFSKDNLSIVLGNGEAAVGKSTYGAYIDNLKQQGLYQSDIGIIGYYSKFGIVATLVWIFLCFKVLRIKVHGNYLYVKMYFGLLILTSFTSSYIFNKDFIAASCFALYLADISRIIYPKTLVSNGYNNNS